MTEITQGKLVGMLYDTLSDLTRLRNQEVALNYTIKHQEAKIKELLNAANLKRTKPLTK